jgi:hypothetical protein
MGIRQSTHGFPRFNDGQNLLSIFLSQVEATLEKVSEMGLGFEASEMDAPPIAWKRRRRGHSFLVLLVLCHMAQVQTGD